MTTLNSAPSLVNTFPTPPVYYHQYSDEKIGLGQAPPPPPIPPKGECFFSFNAPLWNDDHIVRPLESLAIKRLYPQHFDRKRELKKVLHSVLATFLDLIDTLVKCPRSVKRNEKLEDINLLFIHLQHLLNEYRVHQARDVLRTMLEVQGRHTMEVANRLSYQVERVSEMVASSVGTNTAEQNQKSLASSLRLDVGGLHSRTAKRVAQLKSIPISMPDDALEDMAVDGKEKVGVSTWDPLPVLPSYSYYDQNESEDMQWEALRSSSFSRSRRYSFGK